MEVISEEERYMLRKVGLKMKPFLLIGEFSKSAIMQGQGT